jgi:hypothetical protein
MPRNASSFDCRMTYPLSRQFAEGPLFKAEAMEDKWDVYCFDPHLYFVRSWTGALEYRATIRTGGDLLAITRIESAGGRDADFSIRTLDYLVKSHIFGVVVPHPLPSELPAEPMQIAAWSFSSFGRRCALGTYADPTGLPWGTRE